MPTPTILVVDDSPTLLKLAELALIDAGHHVKTVASAEEAFNRAQKAPPALLLIDSPTAGSDEEQFWTRWSQDEQLRHVPVVLMRSDASPGAPRPAVPITDVITKPFTPDALRAVVIHALDLEFEEAPEDSAEPRRLSLTPPPDVAVAESRIPPLGAAGLAGNLEVFSFGDVLGLISERQSRGLLIVARDRAHVNFYFRQGRLDMGVAMGVPEEFLIGRFLVMGGALSQETLDDALASRGRKDTNKVLGALLVERNLITEKQLEKAMAQQSAALVHEVMRWNRGQFSFEPQASWPDAARQAALALPTEQLVMEGLRRIDEWRVIEKEISDFDQIFVRDEKRFAALPRGALVAEEITVAALVDGQSTVKQIVAKAGMGAYGVSKNLFRLSRAKLIRPRIGPGTL